MIREALSAFKQGWQFEKRREEIKQYIKFMRQFYSDEEWKRERREMN